MSSILYDVLYYVYVLFFGVYVSIRIACGTVSAKGWKVFAALCPLLLILQGICLQLFGMDMVWRLYPAIVHLPLALCLILVLRAKWDAALFGVIISYSMCQLLRWIGLLIEPLGFFPWVTLLLHLSLCQLLLLVLNRFCLGAIHNVIVRSPRMRWWFGALPVLYYLYEYFMLYTQRSLAHLTVFAELLPTAMVFFFILFVIAYQREIEKREQAEQQTAALEMELSQASREITLLHAIEEKTAIYRHDLRHHLMAIETMLSTKNNEQASAYIHDAVSEIESIAPTRYCENETVNLLLSAFKEKAAVNGICMTVKAALGEVPSLPETELCAVLSNGMENALNAASCLPEGARRWIDVFCGEKQNTLLIEIKNPYAGGITMLNGIPVAADGRRHYGCRSIQSIVQRRKGVCTFDAANGTFVLRIAIPLHVAPPKSI